MHTYMQIYLYNIRKYIKLELGMVLCLAEFFGTGYVLGIFIPKKNHKYIHVCILKIGNKFRITYHACAKQNGMPPFSKLSQGNNLKCLSYFFCGLEEFYTKELGLKL